MKRILWVLICCVLGASSASGWVLLTDTINPEAAQAQLFPKLLSGKPLRICIDILESKQKNKSTGYMEDVHYQGDKRFQYYSDIKDIIEGTFDEWFDTTAKMIYDQKRQKEFSDILGILSYGSNLLFINQYKFRPCDTYAMEDIDIKVRATLYPVRDHAVSTSARSTIAMHFQPDHIKGGGVSQGRPLPSYYATLHEMGHVLGLGDQYAGRSGAEHNSTTYTLSKFIPLPKIESVMGNTYENPFLTCDDVDGLINDIDVQLANQLANSPHRTQGWLSFCSTRKVGYAYGIPFAVTNEEISAEKEFLSHKKSKGDSPLASKAKQAALQDQEVRAQAAHILTAEEKNRRAQADSIAISEAVNRSSAQDEEYRQHVAAVAAEEATHLCAVCGKIVKDSEGKKFRGKISNRFVYVHNDCRDDFPGMSKVNPKYIHTDK